MKITTQGMPRNPELNNNNAQALKAKKGSSDSVAKSADFDKISIGKDEGGRSDAQLIAALKKSIMSDLMVGASEQKLNDLRQQIALGEYDVNPSDIAKKMLLDVVDTNEVNND